MAVVGQDARDEDEPKPAIIALIIKAIQAKAAATAGAATRRAAATQRAQKAELEQLKLPELRKRAAQPPVLRRMLSKTRGTETIPRRRLSH